MDGEAITRRLATSNPNVWGRAMPCPFFFADARRSPNIFARFFAPPGHAPQSLGSAGFGEGGRFLWAFLIADHSPFDRRRDCAPTKPSLAQTLPADFKAAVVGKPRRAGANRP